MINKERREEEKKTLAEMLPELTERDHEKAQHETSTGLATELMSDGAGSHWMRYYTRRDDGVSGLEEVEA